MRPVIISIRRFAIFCHRWMGVAFCLLFSWWFLSGIFMMYWDFPGVGEADRRERSPALDASRIQISPRQAWEKLGLGRAPTGARLEMFDGRPVYRFASGGRRRGGEAPALVHADDGTVEPSYPRGYPEETLLRIAGARSRQPVAAGQVEKVTQTDQWTVEGRLRTLRPLWKYSFPDGQQVYISGASAEVVQYTTTGSRLGAWLGAIPHWLYFTPLRMHQKLWTNLVIWLSGLGTIMALLGLIAGISMCSPWRRYRHNGALTIIPYTGPKRLHMLLGLFFGIIACTWAFSGMLSMDPPFLTSNPPATREGPAAQIQAALRPGRFDLAAYGVKSPKEALVELGGASVKELEFSSFDGVPVYLAFLDSQQTRIVPVNGDPKAEYDSNQIFNMVTRAAGPGGVSEARPMTRYDAYYLDRHHERPLPILFVRVNDPAHSQLYIDQRTGRLVGQHSDNSSFTTRWLYHGLHSMDFPWLYNHRPAWDIVVLTLMVGGLSLALTSLILAWQLLKRKLNLL